MAGENFYDRQIGVLDSRETINELNGMISDYLNATSIEEVNLIKNTILGKAQSELNQEAFRSFRDNISERAKQETGQNKRRLYELACGFYNSCSPQIPQNYQTQQPSQQGFPQQGFERNENLGIPFEVAGGSIKQKAIGINDWNMKVQNKEYAITGGNVESLGNGIYAIHIFTQGRSGREDIVYVSYNGGNTIQILDERGQQIVGTVTIKNRNEFTESTRRTPRGYERRGADLNSFVGFEIKQNGKTIRLQLSFPNR